jgi:hypothetical protein
LDNGGSAFPKTVLVLPKDGVKEGASLFKIMLLYILVAKDVNEMD